MSAKEFRDSGLLGKSKRPARRDIKTEIERMLSENGYHYEKEKKFHHARKWRFDFAVYGGRYDSLIHYRTYDALELA